MMKTLKGARLLDPGQNFDAIMDILIVDGKIGEIKPDINISDTEIIDLSGKLATPGLIDMHVHFRDPGYEYKEDIESGSMSAALEALPRWPMPNATHIRQQFLIEYVKSKAKGGKGKSSHRLRDQGPKGEEITEMGDMVRAGA